MSDVNVEVEQPVSGGQDRSNGFGIHYHIDDSSSKGTWYNYLGKEHRCGGEGAPDDELDIEQRKRERTQLFSAAEGRV